VRLPHLFQPLDKAASKPVRKEKWRAAMVLAVMNWS
jgi:hypothetical protein